MEKDTIQNWTVLKNDTTLKRAIKKANIDKIENYQKDQLDIAVKFCKSFEHAIDIGANYGVMTYNMSKTFNKVSTFEIVPTINECLKINIGNFNLKNVDIYDCGLGDKEEKVSLIFDSNKTFSTHVDKSTSGNNLIKTLDSFNFTDVDFIKIDAEGYEPLIIQGGIKTIIKYKPVILYERKGHERRYGHDTNTVLEMLKPYGYKNLAKIGAKNGVIGVI